MNGLRMSRYSLVSSLGSGLAATLAALRAARSGLRPCDFETVTLETCIGAVDGLECQALAGEFADYDCRNNRLARRALDEDGFAAAVAAARARYGAHRIGVFAGTSTAGIHESEIAFRHRDAGGALPAGFRYRGAHNTYSIAEFVRQALQLTGPAFAISAACASTAKAFAAAARMIALDVCDAAVVGGADSLCLTTLYGFHSLQLTAAGACRPYDAARDGISIGEAAGFVLLERAMNARGDGIVLLGVGESSDAHHMSAPHPEGLGALQAMQAALSAAGLEPGDIDYVNLHGTATKVGDAAEDRAIATLYGAATPCSSTKGLTGHTLGAAGVVEAIIAALCLEHGFIPASPTTRTPDPALQSRYVTAGAALPLRRVMSNSFGFGGSNCSLVLGLAS
ncbi:MAG: beta-ketoacyl-ACP synthase [Gammaproteobacteria bacterium]|nr:beta-ketoacyl-ACP synthase [Gammaproteobacteria bacterium]MBI5615130.1 beta-ketoacyl-ACP synthase [Gammaproteobacteria bacterium]